MTTVQANEGQTIFDIALKSYGDLDGGLAQILADNPAVISSEGLILKGQLYKIDASKVINKRVFNALSITNPTTDETETMPDNVWVTASGDFWATSSGDFWAIN